MRGVLFIVIGLAILPAAAHADFTTHPLDGHAGAISAFTGNQLFSDTVGTDTLDIRVDYAVFTANAWLSLGGVFTPFSGFPALGATDFVYAYQIYNQGLAEGGLGTESMSQLSITVPGGSVLSVGEETGGTFEPVGDGNDPVFGAALIGSVLYDYGGDQVLINTFSTVLLFSSPNGPVFDNASVINTGLSDQQMLPSPVPEPGAALLGFLGLGLVGAVKRRLA